LRRGTADALQENWLLMKTAGMFPVAAFVFLASPRLEAETGGPAETGGHFHAYQTEVDQQRSELLEVDSRGYPIFA